MATAAWSSWWRERRNDPRLPAAALQAVVLRAAGAHSCGSSAGSGASVMELAAATVGALLLLAQFRIWDDIADRLQDAIAHPDRVLVRATLSRHS